MYIDAWVNFKSDHERQHKTYEGKQLLIPELTILGWLHFKRALPNALNPTRHKGMFEVFYMVQGTVDWYVDGKKIVLHGGDFVLIAPNKLHGSEASILQPCEHFWLRFKYPKVRAIAGLTIKETKEVITALCSISGLCIRGGETNVKRIFEELMEVHRDKSRFSRLRARALFIEFLVTVVTHAATRKNKAIKNTAHLRAKIDKSLLFLADKGATAVPSISQLAAIAGLKESTFRRVFEQEIGVTPSHYITSCRISQAKQYLLEGRHITEIAHSLLFPSSQYFATVFKQWTGLRPTEFAEFRKADKVK